MLVTGVAGLSSIGVGRLGKSNHGTAERLNQHRIPSSLTAIGLSTYTAPVSGAAANAHLLTEK